MTFVVVDLDRMEELLAVIFDARMVDDSGMQTFSWSRKRLFLIGKGKESIWVGTMEGEPLPMRTYSHVAFKIGDDETLRRRLLIAGGAG